MKPYIPIILFIVFIFLFLWVENIWNKNNEKVSKMTEEQRCHYFYDNFSVGRINPKCFKYLTK